MSSATETASLYGKRIRDHCRKPMGSIALGTGRATASSGVAATDLKELGDGLNVGRSPSDDGHEHILCGHQLVVGNVGCHPAARYKEKLVSVCVVCGDTDIVAAVGCFSLHMKDCMWHGPPRAVYLIILGIHYHQLPSALQFGLWKMLEGTPKIGREFASRTSTNLYHTWRWITRVAKHLAKCLVQWRLPIGSGGKPFFRLDGDGIARQFIGIGGGETHLSTRLLDDSVYGPQHYGVSQFLVQTTSVFSRPLLSKKSCLWHARLRDDSVTSVSSRSALEAVYWAFSYFLFASWAATCPDFSIRSGNTSPHAARMCCAFSVEPPV